MIWLLWLPATLAAPRIFPLVDPGLFVISGVSTCGEGGGYCLLGLDCTLDEDFLPDLRSGQHCEGLRSAFTPSAHFVCCRTAPNRTSYNPPAVSTTEKLTTLNELENEIDEVVLKVAQSVDSIKGVTTEKSEETKDDNDRGEMMADSPEMEDNEESSEEEESEESEEDSSYPSVHVSSVSSETVIPNEVTESSSSEEESSEESADRNTESSENVIVQQLQDFEMTLKEYESSLKSDRKPELETNSTSEEVDFSRTENSSENSDDKFPNFITSDENSIEIISPKEPPLQNEILHDMVVEGSEEKDKSSGNIDMADTVTPTSDQVTPKTQMSKDSELHTDVSIVPKPSTSDLSNNKTTSNTSSTINNSSETVMPVKEEVNNTQSVNKEENNPSKPDVPKENTMPSNPPQTINTTEDRLGTTTTVSPDSSTTDNGQLPPMGEITQGQPKPCSRNCSENIMFEFQNQALCFGSMFTTDWVVTSASCALRIFRMGMVNVNASLADANKRGVKTIVIHESYGESVDASGQEFEANNIGLVRVAPGPGDPCLSCLPDVGQLPQDNCSAVSPTYSKSQNCSIKGSCEGRASSENEGNTLICEGPSKFFTDNHGFPYISLACDTPWPRSTMMAEMMPTKLWGKGTPLFCDGVLAGVESSIGAGAVVYTPISHYLNWLDHNTHPGLPEQHFNLG